jgi:uncharacterized protein
VLVYEADKRQFLEDNDDRNIEDVILERFKATTGRGVSVSEIRSWKESLREMAGVLRDKDIPDDTGVGVEFHIPQSSKRIDITLTGHGPEGRKNAVVIELKQWQQAQATPKDGIVVTFVGHANREVVHPSYQAWSYASLLEGFNEAVNDDGGIAVRPCAYLHNYHRDGVIDSPHYEAYTALAPLFLRGEAERRLLRDFIKKYVKKGDSRAVLYELSNGRIRPSKALADGLKGLLKGNPEFVLIDDQKEVFEAALAAGRTATPEAPQVVIVEGGPGTGKTVLAINLLSKLTSDGLNCRYVSKNAAPRKVYASKLAGTVSTNRFEVLFGGSGAFIKAGVNDFDVLIVDEAHRLNAKSGFYGVDGVNQIMELIKAAKCVIFFIDEDQRISLDDIGTKADITEYANTRKPAKASVQEYSLASQFRCSGSDGYMAWLDNTLDIRGTANFTLPKNEYDFQVFDSPQAMHSAIEAKNGSNKARVVAGYCWKWITKKKDPKGFDIVIGEDYKRRWNLDKDGSLWIVTEGSINEVGCIHTCQGLELDYVGVIIGPDFIVRNGKVQTVPKARAQHDKTMKGLPGFLKADKQGALEAADRIIKNTYRTLMSRGMKGCYLYCTDPETAAYFKAQLAIQ